MAKIGIFTGTVYGNALLVAEEAQPVLEAQGHEVKVFEDPHWPTGRLTAKRSR